MRNGCCSDKALRMFIVAMIKQFIHSNRDQTVLPHNYYVQTVFHIINMTKDCLHTFVSVWAALPVTASGSSRHHFRLPSLHGQEPSLSTRTVAQKSTGSSLLLTIYLFLRSPPPPPPNSLSLSLCPPPAFISLHHSSSPPPPTPIS